MAKRVVLHYGGREYKLDENHGNVLEELAPKGYGMAEVPLADGSTLRFLLGPGIPAAVVETDRSGRDPMVVLR